MTAKVPKKYGRTIAATPSKTETMARTFVELTRQLQFSVFARESQSSAWLHSVRLNVPPRLAKLKRDVDGAPLFADPDLSADVAP
jgi:hypothetical protein